jgi:ribosomal protein S18 acetylase RimI-like enzyme
MRQGSGWIIRAMTMDDYDAVYQLWRNTPGMGLNTTDDSREGIAAYLKRNPSTCFVAVEGDRVVGVILSGHDGRRGFIHHTAVSGERQKNGIGSALVEHAMQALEREGIHKVALVVFSHNEKGNAFWEKRGFTRRDDLVYRNRSITELTRIET